MSDDEDYNSEEDLDYAPSDPELLSEEENSGDEEDLSLLHDGEAEVKAGSVRKRCSEKKKKSNIIEARKRKGGIKLNNDEKIQDEAHSSSKEGEEEEETKRKEELAKEILQEQEMKKEEKEKKRADDLWSSFLADTGTKKPVSGPAQSCPSGAGLGSLSNQIKSSPQTDVRSVASDASSSVNSGEKSGKVTITKVFDFAGEEIKITKEVDAESKEAKAEQKKLDKEKEDSSASSILSKGPSIPLGLKRPAVGGLGSVLNKISKKNKMGTLEKSKLDWNSFKQQEGIEEDLKIHNKGKQGYTERIAFLNRADQRQYEIERDIRLGKNSKR